MALTRSCRMPHISPCFISKWVLNFPVQIGWKMLRDTCIRCLFLSRKRLVRHLFSSVSVPVLLEPGFVFSVYLVPPVSSSVVTSVSRNTLLCLSFVFKRSCANTLILIQVSCSSCLFEAFQGHCFLCIWCSSGLVFVVDWCSFEVRGYFKKKV